MGYARQRVVTQDKLDQKYFVLPFTHPLPHSFLQHGSKVFAYFYGMFNIYVLLLAFCYTPAGSVYGDINTNDNVRSLFVFRVS